MVNKASIVIEWRTRYVAVTARNNIYVAVLSNLVYTFKRRLELLYLRTYVTTGIVTATHLRTFSG